MDLRTAFAGVLRALRLVRGARYADLSDATHRRKIAELENAQTSITLEQFDALAESLGLDAIALMALCVSERDGVMPQQRILDSIAKLTDFEASGGMGLIREQFNTAGSLVKRSRGRPLNIENEKAVLVLKAEGASPQQAATKLGLALSSVMEYWRK
ncbi:XRE family transcriptional regulator [Pseudomonas sp. R4-83]|uniref:XRE family transcriptional regulator n=1 Tax=unclassified Pseudomonas TaxID=196821 RepID=UPI003DAA0F07